MASKKAIAKKTIMTAKQRVQRLAASDWPSDLMIAFNTFIQRVMHFARAAREIERKMIVLPDYDDVLSEYTSLVAIAESMQQDPPCHSVQITLRLLRAMNGSLRVGGLYDYANDLWPEALITQQKRIDRVAFCHAAADVFILVHTHDEVEETITALKGASEFARVMLNERLARISIELESHETNQDTIANAMYQAIEHRKDWNIRLSSTLWRTVPLFAPNQKE